jgi:hypothetical protein
VRRLSGWPGRVKPSCVPLGDRIATPRATARRRRRRRVSPPPEAPRLPPLPPLPPLLPSRSARHMWFADDELQPVRIEVKL